MGIRQKEQGRYTLPAGEFNRFVREFSAVWDKRVMMLASLADGYYQDNKGKTVMDLVQGVQMKLGEKERLHAGDAIDMFFPADPRKKITKPTKKAVREKGFKNLRKAPDGSLRKSVVIDVTNDAQITINFEHRELIWEVDETKNAVEEARKHPLADWFFRFLGTVKWRGSTGGEVEYMDENMEDAGQWDPSISDRHGYAKKAYDDQFKRMMR